MVGLTLEFFLTSSERLLKILSKGNEHNAWHTTINIVTELGT